MAVTVTATQIDDAAAWITVGDRDWVPDVGYYRRFRLAVSGDAGEVRGVCNWEIYDTSAIPFNANASTATVQATGGTYTGANAPAFLNSEHTQTVWVRNAKAQDAGAPYYDDTGRPWVSALRASGVIVDIEMPVTFGWGAANARTTNFRVAAYLPGTGGRVPAGVANITVANPKTTDLK